MNEITVRDFARDRAAGATPLLLDVREAWEVAIAAIPGAVHIPMNEIPDRLADLPRDREIVVMCKAGGRSMNVARFLVAQGYGQVTNLTGGILAWSADVDPTVATY